MKKFLIICSTLFSSIVCVMADHDDNFVRAMKNCSPYTSNGALDAGSTSVDYNSRILGWINNKCHYRKTVTFSGQRVCIDCKFTQTQLNRLVQVMQANAKTNFEADFDITNPEALQSNPAMQVWSEYFYNPSVCSMSIE